MYKSGTATLKRNGRGPTRPSFLPPWRSIACSTIIFWASMLFAMISFVLMNHFAGFVASGDVADAICYDVCGLDGGVAAGGFGSDANGVDCSDAGAERNVGASSAASGTAAEDTLRGAVVHTPGGGQLLPCAADGGEVGHLGYAVARFQRSVVVVASCAAARRGPEPE